MSLIELERKFDRPNSIRKVYLKPQDKEEYLSAESRIDELGRQYFYRSFSEEGRILDEGTIRFPTKLIEITEIVSSSGDRDEITQEYNQNNYLIYESFQFGWDGTKDEIFIKYNENGTIHSMSDVENIFKEVYAEKGYHFEYDGLDLKRIYRKEGKESTTIVELNTLEKEKEVLFIEDDEIERKLIFKFDDKNRIIEEVNIRYDNYSLNEISSNCKKVYEYHDNGSLKTEYFKDYDVETNELTDIEETQFDRNGIERKRMVSSLDNGKGYLEKIIYNKKEPEL